MWKLIFRPIFKSLQPLFPSFACFCRRRLAIPTLPQSSTSMASHQYENLAKIMLLITTFSRFRTPWRKKKKSSLQKPPWLPPPSIYHNSQQPSIVENMIAISRTCSPKWKHNIGIPIPIMPAHIPHPPLSHKHKFLAKETVKKRGAGKTPPKHRKKNNLSQNERRVK